MTYPASVDTPEISEEIYTSRLLIWTSEKGSRSCTRRGKSFSQPGPRLWAALREDEAHKEHQLKVSTHTKDMRNLQVRAQQLCKEVLVCSEWNPILLLQNAQCRSWATIFHALLLVLIPSSHSPFHFTCCCHTLISLITSICCLPCKYKWVKNSYLFGVY